jgi:tetratricopeptide (TPR) repeat protein
MECRIVDLQDCAYGFLDPDAAARVRDHAAGCGRCRAGLARLESEKERLAEAVSGLSAPRERRPAATAVVPLAFAAALLLGLLWLLSPRDPAPVETVAVPAAQEKKAAKEAPEDEGSLKAEIARLEAALQKTSDEQERSRIQTGLGDLKIRLERLTRGKDDKTAMKEKPEANPKKPLVKGKPDPADDRAAKVKTELDGTYQKIKMSKDPEERKFLESRAQELVQELKLLEQGSKMQVNFKEVDRRLQMNPDDTAALVDRATWLLDNGKADPAMKDLDHALALRPDLAPAYLKRAVAHAMLGQQALAWQDAKRGEELDVKAGKAIDDTYRAIKKLMAPKERKPAAGDTENQIAALRDRLEELRAMAENADLAAGDRERARRDADRVQVEIDRLAAELKSRPAEPEKKFEKKK